MRINKELVEEIIHTVFFVMLLFYFILSGAGYL